MARGQDAAGRRRPGGALTRPPLLVLVHDRRSVEAALRLAAEQGVAVELVIEAGIGGPAFVAALEELLGQRLVVLCDESAGLALESLRTGLRRLVFAGDPAQARRLADIADQLGGEVLTALPGSLHGRSSDGRRFVPLRPSVDLGGDAPLVP